MGKRSQAYGSTGEDIAVLALRGMGVEMVEHIATPFATVARNKQGWIRIKYKERVSADIIGVMPGGRRVLAEVKSTNEDRLVFSRLRSHQVEALDKNHELGAISLLVLVHPYGYCVMRWPIEGFKPRTSILVEDAYKHEWDGKT